MVILPAVRTAAARLLQQRRAFQPGSLEWNWRTRAAWKLDQIARGVPADDWTDAPPAGLLAWSRIDPEYKGVAA